MVQYHVSFASDFRSTFQERHISCISAFQWHGPRLATNTSRGLCVLLLRCGEFFTRIILRAFCHQNRSRIQLSDRRCFILVAYLPHRISTMVAAEKLAVLVNLLSLLTDFDIPGGSFLFPFECPRETRNCERDNYHVICWSSLCNLAQLDLP
jgi:hypothetical protein